MKRNTTAFTLIEVLIALLIIAIALAAAIRATNVSIRTATNVRNTMAAHFVGLNILSEIQTGLSAMPTVSNPKHGETRLLGKEWAWTAKDESEADNVMRVMVTVRLKGHRVTSIAGYV